MSTGPVISLANFPMGSGPCEGKTLPIMSTIEEMSPFPSYSASGALADSPFPPAPGEVQGKGTESSNSLIT